MSWTLEKHHQKCKKYSEGHGPKEKISTVTCSSSRSLPDASEAVFSAGCLEALNTRPCLWPLPRTRSEGAAEDVGSACFGGGSMLNRDDEPAAPDCSLGFLAGGLSTSSPDSAGKAGRLIVIFLGGRFGFADGLVDDFSGLDGGGSGKEDLDEVESDFSAGGDDGRTSLSASLSLP